MTEPIQPEIDCQILRLGLRSVQKSCRVQGAYEASQLVNGFYAKDDIVEHLDRVFGPSVGPEIYKTVESVGLETGRWSDSPEVSVRSLIDTWVISIARCEEKTLGLGR